MLYVYLRHAVTVTSRGMRQVLARYQIDMHDDTQVRVCMCVCGFRPRVVDHK